MTEKRPHFAGWWEVPDGLMTATELGRLEFPREPTASHHASVTAASSWRYSVEEHFLYVAQRCPPTAATGANLAAAAARSSRPRSCADCGAYPQRPLPVDVGGRPLCPVCLSVALLRREQAEAREKQAHTAAWIAELLAWPDARVFQVDLTDAPRAESGRARPPIAARVRACDVRSGKRVLDVLCSLVGPKSALRDPDAVPAADARPVIHKALLGRPLIYWADDELKRLRRAAPDPGWPAFGRYGPAPRGYAVHSDSMVWRAQLNQRRQLVPSLAPGSPDRLLLHLQRIAATACGPSAPPPRPADAGQVQQDGGGAPDSERPEE
jgi:hypothetical protein